MGDFGRRLKRERTVFGMTQADLGDATGMGRDRIAKIETSARKVSAEELVLLAQAFETSVDALLGADDTVRYRVNLDQPATKEAIAWFDRCVANSLFVKGLDAVYDRHK
ncbi:MAG: helix-turn-helix domain-containing protein [Chloroflexota bacterium]